MADTLINAAQAGASAPPTGERVTAEVHAVTDATAAPRHETADRGVFVSAMGTAVTGVNVITTDGPAGRFGLTVSAMSSVSADPPTVLVCINRRSPVCAAVRANRAFCVNVLSTRQRSLAETFAGHPARGKPFDFTGVACAAGVTGAPALSEALSTFDCELDEALDAGSHTVFFGRVVAVHERKGVPLLYTHRAYGRPCAGH